MITVDTLVATRARRAGKRTRIIDRRGDCVHVTHDASGACHLVTIPD